MKGYSFFSLSYPLTHSLILLINHSFTHPLSPIGNLKIKEKAHLNLTLSDVDLAESLPKIMSKEATKEDWIELIVKFSGEVKDEVLDSPASPDLEEAKPTDSVSWDRRTIPSSSVLDQNERAIPDSPESPDVKIRMVGSILDLSNEVNSDSPESPSGAARRGAMAG